MDTKTAWDVVDRRTAPNRTRPTEAEYVEALSVLAARHITVPYKAAAPDVFVLPPVKILPFGRPPQGERCTPCATFRRTMNPIGTPNPVQGEVYTIGAPRYLPECWQVGAARFWAVADEFKGWTSTEGSGQRTAEKYWWDSKFRRIPTDAGVLEFDRHFREDVPRGGVRLQLPETELEAARAALVAVHAIYQAPLDVARYEGVFAVRFGEHVRLFEAVDHTPTGWREVSEPYKAMGTLDIPVTLVADKPFDTKIVSMWSYNDGDGDGRLGDFRR